MIQEQFILQISKQLTIAFSPVKNTLELLESGATIPFIARYWKEATQNLDEVQIAAIQESYQRILEFEKRKNFILKSKVLKTFVNGTLVYDNGTFDGNYRGKRLIFSI